MPKLKDINASFVNSINDDVVSIFVNLSSIAIENLENLTSEGVDTIVRNNPNLETLSLFGCPSVDEIGNIHFAVSPH